MTQSVTLPRDGRRIYTEMTFSPDNKILAVVGVTSCADDTVVRLFDVQDLTLQRQFKWHLTSWRFPLSLADILRLLPRGMEFDY
jgi:WD40 repeat protein